MPAIWRDSLPNTVEPKVPSPKRVSMTDRLAFSATPAPQPKIELEAPNHMNVSADIEKNMSFKVSNEFHLRFKATSAASGKSMKELLEEGFELWLKAHNG